MRNLHPIHPTARHQGNVGQDKTHARFDMICRLAEACKPAEKKFTGEFLDAATRLGFTLSRDSDLWHEFLALPGWSDMRGSLRPECQSRAFRDLLRLVFVAESKAGKHIIGALGRNFERETAELHDANEFETKLTEAGGARGLVFPTKPSRQSSAHDQLLQSLRLLQFADTRMYMVSSSATHRRLVQSIADHVPGEVLPIGLRLRIKESGLAVLELEGLSGLSV